MQFKLDAGGTATIAGLGVLAYLFWKYRPIEQVNQIIDSTVAAIQNAADGDDNGQLDFMEAILGGQTNVTNLSEMEKVYEIDTNKSTLDKMFIGSKPFAVPLDQVQTLSPNRGVYAAPLPTPLGDITASGGPFWTTDAGRANAGKLDSRGEYVLAYNGNAHGRTIKGDPRALYCLDALIKRSGLTRIDHLGMVLRSDSAADMKKDYGHRRGHAIDLTNDVQMNKLLEAAKALSMPLGWISRFSSINPLTGNMEWPKFALVGGMKVQKGYSSINHNSHYHLIFPRPNRALGYWLGSPFRSGSWNPTPSITPGFIPDNNGGPPPISSN